MGFMLAFGECVACHRPLSFNPELVPSIRVNGNREPLCEGCVRKWEKLHGQTIRIAPGAYAPQEVA